VNKTIIYLIRHAQSIGNVLTNQGVEISSNPLGTDLTEEGILQANKLANDLANAQITAIYTSPLLRALRTAEILAKDRKLNIQIIEDLRERRKGSLNGLTVTRAKNKYQYIYGDPNKLSDEEMLSFKLFPDMESVQEAAVRLTKTLVNLAEKNVGRTIAVISHGNIIRSFLIANKFATFEQLPTGSFDNSGYVKLAVEKEKFTILKTHLVEIWVNQ
jgi:broad specificity phosphatase PhoE